MQRDRRVFGAICPTQMGSNRGRRAGPARKGKVLMPRSSSPVTVYVEKMPCIIEHAFSTIAWNDLEDSASVVRRENDSLGSQVTESDGDDHDFGDYTLDFMPDSPATLENSLSPSGLVPLQGCIIPPLTPLRDFSPEEGLDASCAEACNPQQKDEGLWKDVAQHQGRALGESTQVNNQLHEALHRKEREIDALQERNSHLRELASRAKQLATVLDQLLTVRDAGVTEPQTPDDDKPSLSPCKRQRLDEGRDTDSSDSVEDILRDISTRCNAVLHSKGTGKQPDTETVRMHGTFSHLRTSFVNGGGSSTGDEESVASFRTSIGEHCNIRTQVFPNGSAFTSTTPQGGYRFRWVPNHN